MSFALFAVMYVFVAGLYELDHRNQEECNTTYSEVYHDEESSMDYVCIPANENPNL